MKTAAVFAIMYPSVLTGFLLVLVIAMRWCLVHADRKRSEYILLVVLFTSLLSGAAQAIANHLSAWRPMKYDLYIYRVDALFGQPSFVLGRFVDAHLWLQLILHVSYGLLPTAVSAVLGLYILRRESQFPTALRTFLLNLMIAPLFYMLIPVCGPAFAFPDFPHVQIFVTPHLIALTAPPNGMPSVHTSTALLIAWFSRHWEIGRWLSIVYLALIVASTLASGQHYLLDLLAAVPYAWIVAWTVRMTEQSRPLMLVPEESSTDDQ